MQITLEAARINAGMSQKEAGSLFGVNYQTLAKWENDNSQMPYAMIQKIPEIYGIPQKYIFFGTKNEFIRLLKEKKFLQE